MIGFNFFFSILLLIIFVVMLIFFGLVYLVLDFRYINFFMVSKMKKILELQTFL